LSCNIVYNSFSCFKDLLYTMLQDKGTKLKDISEKVKVVNQSYKDIESEKDKFNEFTKSYNTEKVAFYKQANIKIKEEKK
ncbi:YkyA family protein, partial [Bacillus cereus group sp. BceL245]|uniref:YkyA family protein n=1 Tax=Bacillus cereus group sp. BceL245 TaxID=3444998 RepID=UPI0040420850